jgi:putative transposase
MAALEMAIWVRGRHGHGSDRAGASTRSGQYTAIGFTERLAATGVDASVGTVANAYYRDLETPSAA